MQLAVFGATGRVGQKVVQLAIQKGWHVRALVRNIQKADVSISDAELIAGDAKNSDDVKKTIKNCDLVFSGLSTDKSDTLSQAIPFIIEGMKEEKIARIVTIGTAGILNSRYEKDKYRFETSESKRTRSFAAKEHAKVYEMLQESQLDWTIICPTYLPAGKENGNVRFERDLLPIDGNKITVDDTARFAFQELAENRFIHYRVGICY